jgi:hypothetical protein
MKRLWNLPFNLSQCFIPIFLFGPLVSWYYLLINDQYFTKGRNTLLIVVFHLFLIFVFMILLNIDMPKKFSPYNIVFYLGFNFLTYWLNSILEGFLIGDKIESYKSENGKFNDSWLNNFIFFIPLVISLSIIGLFSFIFNSIF